MTFSNVVCKTLSVMCWGHIICDLYFVIKTNLSRKKILRKKKELISNLTGNVAEFIKKPWSNDFFERNLLIFLSALAPLLEHLQSLECH